MRESTAPRGGRGRPRKMLRLNPDEHVVVGVKIGPAQVSAVITDPAAGVLS
ncbi:hypothetical protein [Streptomyces parvus]|uniref:hypothetical protein n=1 Tax=Streptomyces parvus TaxID=66428 RepID=UPI0013DB529B|nr:hypothetical protein [Streptomyces parvus]